MTILCVVMCHISCLIQTDNALGTSFQNAISGQLFKSCIRDGIETLLQQHGVGMKARKTQHN